MIDNLEIILKMVTLSNKRETVLGGEQSTWNLMHKSSKNFLASSVLYVVGEGNLTPHSFSKSLIIEIRLNGGVKSSSHTLSGFSGPSGL